MTNAAWALRAPYLPPASPRGRPRVHHYQVLLDAIFELVRGGCAWRLLPPGALGALPPWRTVYQYCPQWRADGTGERLHTAPRRVRQGQDAQPSAGLADGQSVETTGVGGPRGYDGGKQMHWHGRKRHVLGDTHGLVRRATVQAANLADRDGITLLLPEEAIAEPPAIREQVPRRSRRWLDGGPDGAGRGKVWVERARGWTVAIGNHPRRPRGVWARDDEGIDWAAILPRHRASGACSRGAGWWRAPSRG